MLYITLSLGILILICAAQTMHGSWTKANLWTVMLGAVCVVIGVLMERLRFQQAKNLTEKHNRPYTIPYRDRNSTIPSGWLSMLLAAGFAVLGLTMLMLQAMAFFWG